MRRLLCALFGHKPRIRLKGGRAIGDPTAPRDESTIFDYETRCTRCGELAARWSARQVEVSHGN